jgi:large subunit ribosomal protein L4
MSTIKLFNSAGDSTEEISFADDMLVLDKGTQAVKDTVVAWRNGRRAGTACTKTKAEVAGSNKKPWRQKGTGRARQGSIRSPQWRKGGIVFGPTPRSYAVKMNQKVRQLALRSALSYHAANGQLRVVESLNIEAPKTKLFRDLLATLGIAGKTLIVSKDFSENEVLAARNIPTIAFSQVSHVSVYDILNCKTLLLTKDAVDVLEEVLGND